MPADIAAESKRKPVVQGETGVEVAARLIGQGHQKNAALRRSTALYEDCRKT